MDILKNCAVAFRKLLAVEYNIIIARKGKTTSLTISFNKKDFHHLVGLHKLKDNDKMRRMDRAKIFDGILNDEITFEKISTSDFLSDMQDRLEPFTYIESLLDSNEIIFKYNEKVHKFSMIKAEYLLKNYHNNNEVYVFVDKREGEDKRFCRTFFPKRDRDYTLNQTGYTLLYKEKIDILTSNKIIQYDKLSPKKA